MVARTISSSSGFGFGFRWSLVGICLALFYIASCDLFVPPDNNKPRYNSVYGEKRRPELNPGGMRYQPSQTQDARQGAIEAAGADATLSTPAAPLPQAPEAAPVAAPASAPVAEPAPKPQVRREAPQEEPGFWDRLAFWSEDEAPVKDAPASERRMPVENASLTATAQSATTAPVASNDLAPIQMAANEYPRLDSTPERPDIAATDNTRQRLGAARADMEAERAVSEERREQVARDAAAEPSLLSTRPDLQPKPANPEPLPPPPALPAGVTIPAPAPVAPAPTSSNPVPAAPVAKAEPAREVQIATNGGSAFERLTNRPLTAPAATPQAQAVPPAPPEPQQAAPAKATAPNMQISVADAPAETKPPVAAKPIVAAPVPATAPVPTPVAKTSVAPPDASIPLTAAKEPIRLTPPPSAPVDIAPPPAVASVPTPREAVRPALEPIHLTPPGAAVAEAGATPPPSGNSTLALTPPHAYDGSSGFLPGSRYAQRRSGMY